MNSFTDNDSDVSNDRDEYILWEGHSDLVACTSPCEVTNTEHSCVLASTTNDHAQPDGTAPSHPNDCHGDKHLASLP